MDVTRALVDGSLLSLAASALIFASLRANPRIWLNDFPPDIRRAVPPKTDAEKRQSTLWGIPFLAVLLGGPLLSTVLLGRTEPGATFGRLFFHAFTVAFVFNLVDLLLIDWLVLCALTPRSLVIPGTEGMAGYKDYGHHFRGFLVGTVFSVVVGLMAAGLAMLWPG